MTAFDAVGNKKRVRLLPLAFRKYCCGRYANLRERGFEHGEALLLIHCENVWRKSRNTIINTTAVAAAESIPRAKMFTASFRLSGKGMATSKRRAAAGAIV